MKTHNDSHIDANGTHLQGYIQASYTTLVKAFGPPHGGDGYKVDWEWDIEFPDGTVATIYNWKNGPNYGEYSTSFNDITDWHVGGNEGAAVTNVEKHLTAYR